MPLPPIFSEASRVDAELGLSACAKRAKELQSFLHSAETDRAELARTLGKSHGIDLSETDMDDLVAGAHLSLIEAKMTITLALEELETEGPKGKAVAGVLRSRLGFGHIWPGPH